MESINPFCLLSLLSIILLCRDILIFYIFLLKKFTLYIHYSIFIPSFTILVIYNVSFLPLFSEAIPSALVSYFSPIFFQFRLLFFLSLLTFSEIFLTILPVIYPLIQWIVHFYLLSAISIWESFLAPTILL